MKIKTIFTLCLMGILSPSFASTTPTFSDYKTNVYSGKNTKVKLDKSTRLFRTRFTDLSNSKVNFAGHYVLGFAGCGTNCVNGLLYNTKTGETEYLSAGTLAPCSIGEDSDERLNIGFKPDSKLLILPENTYDGNFDSCKIRYYLQDKGKLKLIHEELYILENSEEQTD